MERAEARIALLGDLKTRIARIGQPVRAASPTAIPFGVAAIDARLPAGGLAMGALHEISCGGPDVEHGSAAALLIAGVLARHPGKVLWMVERADLFAPALDGVGLTPDRVIYAEAGKAKTVLMGMEEDAWRPSAPAARRRGHRRRADARRGRCQCALRGAAEALGHPAFHLAAALRPDRLRHADAAAVLLAGPMLPVTRAAAPLILYSALPASLAAPYFWITGVKRLGTARTALS
jgi:hypothetical protein